MQDQLCHGQAAAGRRRGEVSEPEAQTSQPPRVCLGDGARTGHTSDPQKASEQKVELKICRYLVMSFFWAAVYTFNSHIKDP